MDKVKMRLTVVINYEADPKHYDNPDPKEMAKLDQTNFHDEPEHLIDMINFNSVEVKVEPLG